MNLSHVFAILLVGATLYGAGCAADIAGKVAARALSPVASLQR